MRNGGTARPGKSRKKARPKPGSGSRSKASGRKPEVRRRIEPPGPPERLARLVTVGGGKGGVGKSFLSANVAAALAA